jgi:SAM-dependent methyltransferase
VQDEPELKLISTDSVSFLNFESDNAYDLDLDWRTRTSSGFSFTICNQVLEHVFNPHVAFGNLVHSTRPGGLIYVTIPTINCIHGEPYFYSSGFHPRFLERLAKEHDLDTVGISSWGSAKYLLHAVSGTWLTDRNLRRGLHSRMDIRLPSFILSDGRDPDCPLSRKMGYKDIITDCWGLFSKK